MVKLRVVDNRLSFGNWSIPLIPKDWSSTTTTSTSTKNSSSNENIAAATARMAGRSRSMSVLAMNEPIAVVHENGGTTAKSKSEERLNYLTSSVSSNNSNISQDNRTARPKTEDQLVFPEKMMRSKGTTANLAELAAIITRETEKLEKWMQENGGPQLGFDVDSLLKFPNLPEEIKKARMEVWRATQELSDLVKGPEESMRWIAWEHNNSLSLQAIYHYKIAKSFPIHETATYTQIAQRVGLDEANVRRFVRHAMTNRIFKEEESGVVAHTVASRLLAEDATMDDWVGFCTEDIFPAAGQTITALTLNPSASEPTQTGFCVSNNTTNIEPMFATFGKSPSKAKRMGGAMASLTGGEGYEVSYLLDNYDWAAIDAISGTVVDIGGSHGFICVDLAKRYKNMKFVVQDLPETIASAPRLDGEVGERVRFQAHNFHTVQPVRGADVYFFRWILHNHSDKYSLNILRSLIPALKKGARIVINDHCLPEPNTEGLWDEKIIRTMDLVMLALLNARERTEDDFKTLFQEANPGFKFLGVKRPEGCRMSIVEAIWESEDFGGSEEVLNEQ